MKTFKHYSISLSFIVGILIISLKYYFVYLVPTNIVIWQYCFFLRVNYDLSFKALFVKFIKI